MNTPLADFIESYAHSDRVRLHVPGHKGRGADAIEKYDITEIAGADCLMNANGIIAESEKNASLLFGTALTCYSTEGSSQCIKAMVFLAMKSHGANGGYILAARNAHSSFVDACMLTGAQPVWMYRDSDTAAVSCRCEITADTVRGYLDSMDKPPFAVYITAPDYSGYSPDVKAIAALCGERGIPLLVDNAHGAYQRFLEPPCDPITLGAYMSASSAHKTLAVLTGGAYLHLSETAYRECGGEARDALAIFGSTSPSYLILRSLDLCNARLAEGGDYRSGIASCVRELDKLRSELSCLGWRTEESVCDPFKLVFLTCDVGYTGGEAAAILRANGVECEYADTNMLVLMAAPENNSADFVRLREAFRFLPPRTPIHCVTEPMRPLECAMTVREAALAESETVETMLAVGRICSRCAVPCPPGIPVAVSGEIIDESAARTLLIGGVSRVSVVKNSYTI